MEIRKLSDHPQFSFEGHSRLIRQCWNFILKKGENTPSNLNTQGEEIHVIIAGQGRVTVGERSSEIREGEIIFVPPRIPHVIQNPESPLLHGITIESDWELPAMEAPEASKGVGKVAMRETSRTIDDIVENLPENLSEAEAIQTVVRLFDIGGRLSEQIEEALGLDNDDGVHALERIERKLMGAIVTIADRYRGGGPGFTPRRWR